MSAIKFVPISLDAATDLLVLLRTDVIPGGQAKASALSTVIGEAISIAGEHVSAAELLAAELLELIGRVSGRTLSTIPGPRSLAEAEDALSDLAPVLGNVIALPRTPERETAASIDAAAAKAVLDMPGPITIRPFVSRRQRPREPSHDELDAVSVWAVPHVREVWCGHVVLAVEWDSPCSVRLVLSAKHPEDIAF